MLAFGCWILLTCLTARNFDVAWFWFVEYLKIFVMYAVAAFLIRTPRQIWWLAIMIALTLGYIAYEINYHYFVNHYLGIYHNGYGGLDNNGAGLMLAMGMPLCWFAYEGTTRWWRWLYLAFIPVIVHAVLMTYSRGAMLSLIVACPLLWWRSRQKKKLTVALAGFVLLAIPMMAGAEIKARFLSIQDNEVDASAIAAGILGKQPGGWPKTIRFWAWESEMPIFSRISMGLTWKAGRFTASIFRSLRTMVFRGFYSISY